MDKKAEIRKLWTECFHDSPEFVEMFFARVYNDKQGMLLEIDGKPVSSLLLQQYDFLMHGTTVKAGYIAGAATRRSERGKGYMGQLMHRALQASYQRGDMLCTLIPAHRWLYFYYDRFGFSTVFYVDKQRFTSLHSFSGAGSFQEIDDPFRDDVYVEMNKMEKARGCGIIHSHRDFMNIMDDVNLDADEHFVALSDENGTVASMAWATVGHSQVEVRELLGRDDESRTAAMRALRNRFPNTHFTLLAPAEPSRRNLFARGMGKIVNVKKLLDICASAYPIWEATIRVKDPIIAENNHIFVVKKGAVQIDDTFNPRRLSLDVTIEVLNRIAFSSSKIGEVVGFPSERPHIALMLD